MPTERRTEIRRRRARREKLAKLRRRYVETRSKEEKDKIWQKVLRIHPMMKLEDFLAPASPSQ